MGSLNVIPPLLSEDLGPDTPKPTKTLHHILIDAARRFPNETALVSCHQPGNMIPCLQQKTSQDMDKEGYLRLSYKDLETASQGLAEYFTRNGIVKGDAIVVLIDSGVEWALCLWAATRLACPFVPINAAIATRANEIQHILSFLETIGALIVKDEAIASLLAGNAAAQVRRSKIKSILGSVDMMGWTWFDEALTTTSHLPALPAVDQAMDSTAVILVTSGTTALPKGCPYSNSTVASMCQRRGIIYSLDETRVSCTHSPLFHSAGMQESLSVWAHGGTVVYPNKSFDAGATLQTIVGERCTDMLLVPSMLRAVRDHPALSDVDTTSLQLVRLGGSDVVGSDARACSKLLGAKTVTNEYGMTETGCTTDVFAWEESMCNDMDAFPVGRMARGAAGRICAPGSKSPVRRGIVGELHQGGSTVIDGYIGSGDDQAAFYRDKTGSWHISGDLAIMAESGEITVLGRFKDVINRAGENISPLVIEKVLDQAEGVESSQVVAIPDDVAGEVPAAVIKMSKNRPVCGNLLQQRIIKELGAAFALAMVLDLKELAIAEWPKTATGKIRKAEIRQLVLRHLQCETKPSIREVAPETTETVLTRVWAHFIGMPESELTWTTSLEGMVDSVTMMRFRNQLKKELGKTLTIEELNGNPTITKQAALLDRQQANVLRGDQAAAEPERDGPPNLSDVVQARGDRDTFHKIRQTAEEKLHALGLCWEKDVEDILPFYDFLQDWHLGSPTSVYSRFSFISTKATAQQLRSALEATFLVHGMLRTILVQTASVGLSWLIVRSSKRWFDLMIQDGGSLATVDHLWTRDLRCNGPNSGEASRPVPLFYIQLYFIEATQSAGFALYGDHSTYDAHSIASLFLPDLNRALGDPGKPLPPRPKYSLFANSYYNYRTSAPAQHSLDFSASRFQGISQRRGGLWPPETFASVNGRPERRAGHLLLKGHITPGSQGITKHIKIDMTHNQYLTVHKIPHVIALKAAVAIYNTQQTGHPYAFFDNVQMARTYPFLDRQITKHLPDITEMPGATIECATDNLYLDPAGALSALLSTMHAEQLMQTAHAQCPRSDLHARLSPQDAHFINQDLNGRQYFDYNPVIKPDPDALVRNLDYVGNEDTSIIWWCGMLDTETVQMRITWCDEVLGLQDVEKAMDGFERNLKWIVDGRNWDRKVGECGN
ncbi:MAG: hypothetical protein Q9168_006144 [Polycauliona sp. 1 TL-2023]